MLNSDFATLVAPFSWLDLLAVTLVLASAILSALIIEHPARRRTSVSMLMNHYRREWFRQSVTREPRVYDALMVVNHRQGAAFFASTCMIAIGGCVALIGNIDQLTGLASELQIDRGPNVVWEIRLMLVLVFLVNAFLKFVWSHRVFGYCSVLMAAVPNNIKDPTVNLRADQAADLNISAARAYNRGLRSVYFSLCSLSWLLGAVPLILATIFTTLVLWRREYQSATHRTLLRELSPDKVDLTMPPATGIKDE